MPNRQEASAAIRLTSAKDSALTRPHAVPSCSEANAPVCRSLRLGAQVRAAEKRRDGHALDDTAFLVDWALGLFPRVLVHWALRLFPQLLGIRSLSRDPRSAAQAHRMRPRQTLTRASLRSLVQGAPEAKRRAGACHRSEHVHLPSRHSLPLSSCCPPRA